MAHFLVEATVEFKSPKDWKFRVETIIHRLGRNDWKIEGIFIDFLSFF